MNERECGSSGRADDVLLLGGCDEVVRKQAKELERVEGLKGIWGRAGGRSG
ncbi:hypothetical protein HOY80DRAFT_887613 [Tuber brumale]|nr:hypothetical protein HOY80DRAFT_887613 [Tuber brumale]